MVEEEGALMQLRPEMGGVEEGFHWTAASDLAVL